MVQELAEALIALSTAHGFSLWLGLGREQRAWALLVQGQHAEGVTLLREALAANRATGRQLTQTYQSALLAEAYGNTGAGCKKGCVLVRRGARRWSETTGRALRRGRTASDAAVHCWLQGGT